MIAHSARPGPDPSLARGSSGLAVVLAYLPAAGDEACTRCLRHAVSELERSRLDQSLLTGFTGIAWAVAHIARLDRDPAGNLLDDVDAALLDWLRPASRPRPFDLVSGVTGVGVYALERLPDPAGQALLERVVALLSELATRDGAARWPTPPSLMPPAQRARFPRGRLDLGMAHGAAGVVAFLGAAHAAGAAGARDLLAAAVPALLEHGVSGPGARFPEWIPAPAGPSRLAWCYGDLGIAVALVGAGEAACVSEWQAAGLETARNAAARTLRDSGVVDAGLCHGAAGVAHLFGRLADATGDTLLEEAALRWLEHTLALRRPGTGVGGYAAWYDGWRADPGLLGGAAGVALALHAATSDAEPGWDRLFLPAAPAAVPTAAATKGDVS